MTEAEQRYVEGLEKRLKLLEDRMNRWALNGLSVLDAQNLFAGTGTSPQAARADHT